MVPFPELGNGSPEFGVITWEKHGHYKKDVFKVFKHVDSCLKFEALHYEVILSQTFHYTSTFSKTTKILL